MVESIYIYIYKPFHGRKYVTKLYNFCSGKNEKKNHYSKLNYIKFLNS